MQQTIAVNDRLIASHVGTTPSSGPFTVDFPFFSLDDVVVTVLADGLDDDLAVRLVRGADYTLTGVATEDGSYSSGTVTLVLPVASSTVTRRGDTNIQRLSNFPLQGFFSRLALNAELNRITVVLQELDREMVELQVELDEFEVSLSGVTNLHVGLAPPASPTLNMFWWSTELGQLFIWYDDGNTSQWVPASPSSADSPGSTLVQPEQFGAVGDGVTDDTAALQAACDHAGEQGGGTVYLGPRRYLIDSADLLIPTHVCVRGPYLMASPGMNGTFNAEAATGVLRVNPLFTVRLNGSGSAIERVMVLCKNLTNPAGSLAAKLALVRGFAGKGITIGGTSRHDVSIRNVLVGGFEYGIYSNSNSRMRIDFVFGDNTNGIFTTVVGDMDYISNVHLWPFITSGTLMTTYTVSNVTNSGGLIRITTSAPHILETGDANMVVADVGGVTAANGTWTVTKVDATSFTLNGSVFAGAYTSGGTVKVIPYFRSGVGFDFSTTTDWGQLTTCFAYAYAIGFRVFNCNHVTLNNCGADAYANAYNTETIGMHITGTSSAVTLLGCKTAAQGTGLKIDTAATVEDQISVVGHRFWGNIVYAAQLLDANTTFTGISVQDRNDVSKYYGTMYIGDNAGAVSFIGGDMGASNTIVYQSINSPRPSFTNVVGGTVSMPVHHVVNTSAVTAALARYERVSPTPTPGDNVAQYYYMSDSAGTQAIMGRNSVVQITTTPGAMTARMLWALNNAGTFVNSMTLDPTALQAGVNNTSSLGSSVSAWTNLYLTGFAKTGSTTVGALPAATAALAGARHFVTDANSTTFNATAVGGGANKMAVVCDGTIWKIG